MIENLQDTSKAVLRQKFIAKKKSLPQETRKLSNKQPKLTRKSTRGRTKKPKGKKS